ncbi:MAG: heparan-alpha-glucosaminide N-acetyltransferase domain-containing protein, partial [Eubacteriaceae bacterium]
MANVNPIIKRVHLLDEIRGILIIYIVFYHFIFDLTGLYGVNIAWAYSNSMDYVRIAAVCLFIIISGISCNYSKSNVKRGIKTFLWGVVITFITLLAMPEQIIIFGILHFFGLAMIIGGLLFDKLKKIPAKAGIIASLILFLLTYNLYNGYIGIFDCRINVPQFLLNKYFLFPLGFMCEGIYSSDYYPLLP